MVWVNFVWCQFRSEKRLPPNPLENVHLIQKKRLAEIGLKRLNIELEIDLWNHCFVVYLKLNTVCISRKKSSNKKDIIILYATMVLGTYIFT